LRILGSDTCVDVLTPIAIRPSIESTFADYREIVRNEVRADFVALVHHGPQLARPRLNGKRGGITEASGVLPVRAGFGIHLPHHRAVGFGKHPPFRNIAVGANAYIKKPSCTVGAGIWQWASNDAGDPDVVMACAGDVPTLETLAAVTLSTVKFIDHKATNIKKVKLVLPYEANGIDLISVTGALGSALIGLGPGQTITWYEDQTEQRTTILETNKRP
jgi:XFP C-terminal domain